MKGITSGAPARGRSCGRAIGSPPRTFSSSSQGRKGKRSGRAAAGSSRRRSVSFLLSTRLLFSPLPGAKRSGGPRPQPGCSSSSSLSVVAAARALLRSTSAPLLLTSHSRLSFLKNSSFSNLLRWSGTTRGMLRRQQQPADRPASGPRAAAAEPEDREKGSRRAGRRATDSFSLCFPQPGSGSSSSSSTSGEAGFCRREGRRRRKGAPAQRLTHAFPSLTGRQLGPGGRGEEETRGRGGNYPEKTWRERQTAEPRAAANCSRRR